MLEFTANKLRIYTHFANRCPGFSPCTGDFRANAFIQEKPDDVFAAPEVKVRRS